MKKTSYGFNARAPAAPADISGQAEPAPAMPDALVERLVAEIPAMRAFARSLCSQAEADRACELTLMKYSLAPNLAANDDALRLRLLRLLRQQCHEALANKAAAPSADGPLGRLTSLPPELKEAFALVTGLGMSLTEAGKICDCPPEEIARRLGEARLRLSARRG